MVSNFQLIAGNTHLRSASSNVARTRIVQETSPLAFNVVGVPPPPFSLNKQRFRMRTLTLLL
jgi:hypothetical protein